MSYHYQTERPQLFTEKGQREFLKVRDAAKRLLDKAGAFQMENVLHEAALSEGDSWFRLACVDRLVELGEIRELTANTWAQHCVFVRATL